jgi:two-component system, OmpR family, alkaline phosphatase synthesis response regulator PhoP
MAPRVSKQQPRYPRALVVEDDGVVQLLMRIILERANYLVDCAKDGAEACEKVAQGGYDAVVCDVVMPRMDGPTLHSRLRELRRPEAGRMLFVTGAKLSDAEVQNVRGTGCPLLWKPFTVEELGAAVDEVAQPN